MLRSFLKLPEAEPAAAEGVIVVKALAPIHGPVVRSTVTELVREYREVRDPLTFLATPKSPHHLFNQVRTGKLANGAIDCDWGRPRVSAGEGSHRMGPPFTVSRDVARD